jgi:hypothetical protein
VGSLSLTANETLRASSQELLPTLDISMCQHL